MLHRIIFACFFIGFTGLPLLAQGKDYRPVKPAQLLAVMDRADKVEVYDLRYEESKGSKVIYSSADPKDLTELKAATKVEMPAGWFRCACIPSTGIRLSRQGRELAWIDIFEGDTIRTPLWSSDARIKDLELWLKWFDGRNIATPRQEAEQEHTLLKQGQEAEARWVNAMPASLRPIWPTLKAEMVMGPPLPDVKPLDHFKQETAN